MHRVIGPNGTGDCQEHQDLLEYIVERLEKKNYQLIGTNLHFQHGRKEGEVDILTYRNGTYHMYELKTGKAKLRKAQQQFYRLIDVHPELNVKGIYIGSAGVKRLKNE